MKRTWIWPAIITGFFTLNLVGAAVVIHFARSDPSFATEPDFYERALGWDEERLARERGGSLARSLALASGAGGPTLRVTLALPTGEPLAGATVRAMVFHNARMAEARSLGLTETDPGVYTGPLAPDRPGRWVVRLDGTSGGERFLSQDELFLEPAPGP